MKKRIADLELNTPITITPDVTCREAIEVSSETVMERERESVFLRERERVREGYWCQISN